jgi:8-oxo-dGTP pyrophosphatase MutT (NUDIX family)
MERKIKRTRSSTACIHGSMVLTVRLEDPGSGRIYLFPPGGGLEDGETAAEAAVRETIEETGYVTKVDEESEIVFHYPFSWGGKVYQCTTHLFRAVLVTPFNKPQEVKLEDIHRGIEWVPLIALDSVFDYDPAIRRAMKEIISP